MTETITERQSDFVPAEARVADEQQLRGGGQSEGGGAGVQLLDQEQRGAGDGPGHA